MPNINLRLSELEHAELREWAHGSRRSLQREIVFRLFDGVVTERDGHVAATSGTPVRDEPLAVASVASRSVTAAVVPEVDHVAMERSSRSGCGFDTPKGTKCKLCGRVH